LSEASRLTPRQPWRPTKLLQASFVAHAAALPILAAQPRLWPWVAGALVADHAALTASGLLPRSSLLGPNWTRLPSASGHNMAITIDDGPDPQVTPQVLDILDKYKAVATFFCVGTRVSAEPSLARDILRRGHAIENHSYRHLNYFSVLGPRAMATEIARAQDIIESTVGVTPFFFRAPAGLRNPFLDRVLTQQRLRLATWTRRGFDTVNNQPAKILSRLVCGMRSGDILLLHDGHAARAPDGSPVILKVLPMLLDNIYALDLVPILLRAAL